jgi:hypothetical protein
LLERERHKKAFVLKKLIPVFRNAFNEFLGRNGLEQSQRQTSCPTQIGRKLVCVERGQLVCRGLSV